MDFEVTDFTVEGKCSNCGKCCSNTLPLSAGEVKTIKKYIKKHNIKEQRHNYRVGTDMTCPFRDESNRKYLIYSIRPQICKQFVCNHKIEDIKKSTLDFHKTNRVVFMRNEFFGNPEDVNWFSNILRMEMML